MTYRTTCWRYLYFLCKNSTFSDKDPDPDRSVLVCSLDRFRIHIGKNPDPDPHWNQCGSATLEQVGHLSLFSTTDPDMNPDIYTMEAEHDPDRNYIFINKANARSAPMQKTRIFKYFFYSNGATKYIIKSFTGNKRYRYRRESLPGNSSLFVSLLIFRYKVENNEDNRQC